MKIRIQRSNVAVSSLLLILLMVIGIGSSGVSGETELKTGILAENGNQPRSPESEYSNNAGSEQIAGSEIVVFDNGNLSSDWQDWSWGVERDGPKVSSMNWAGVYFNRGERLSIEDYVSLDVSIDSLPAGSVVLVNLVADVDQPAIEITNGTTQIPLADLAGDEISFYGIQIRSPIEQDFILESVQLTAAEAAADRKPVQAFLPAVSLAGNVAGNANQIYSVGYDLFATSCGELAQEAENGTFHGRMKVVRDGDANGDHAISGSGASHSSLENEDRADYCFGIAQSGTYRIDANVRARDNSRNSFFWTIDGEPNSGHVWHMGKDNGYTLESVSSGGSVEGGNPTETIYLEAGNHVLSFYLREPGTLIDNFEIVPEFELAPPFESCGELAQEAENGTLSGRIEAVRDGEASGDYAVAGNGADHSSSLNSADRADYCFGIFQSGEYRIDANIRARDNSRNSFFWTIDGLPDSGHIWHMTADNGYINQSASSGGSVEGGNPTETIYLEAGNHVLSFYLREPGTLIDNFEIVPADASVDPVPTPVAPTPVPVDPTPTPEKPTPNPVDPVKPGVYGEWDIDWSNAGLNSYPHYSNVIEVTSRSQSAIESAIRNAKPYTRIILPPGEINIGTIDITKSNIILAGHGGGCGETVLRFSSDTGIRIGGSGSVGSSVSLNSDSGRNSREITVSNSSQFNVGDYILIRQNDNSDYFRADLSRTSGETWTQNNATQINKVVGKSGNTLRLEGGLNLEFKRSLNARVAKINNMVSGVGVENLTLERTSGGSAAYGSANIYFKYAANSWVKGVHSINSIRAHVYFDKGYKSEVRGSYLDRSFNNGPGGHGYGVRLEGGTTDVLVENNIARLMRHSYVTQIGANGNVFGYNYSADPLGIGHDGKLGEIYSDLSVHGSFTFSNLFEGNQAQNAKGDNYHASSTGNMFFRNRLEQDLDSYTFKSELTPKGASTPHIWLHENNYFNSFLANEISFPGANRATQTVGFDSGRRRDNFTLCKYVNSSDGERGCGRTRETTIGHGNHDYLQNQTLWDSSISERGFSSSMYLTGKPSFLGSSAWPSFGPDTLDLSEDQKILPAKARFLNAQQERGSYCYLD